jgi:signal transduction histidine kinase
VAESLSEDTPYSIDHRIVLPDGTVRVVHEQAEITRDAAGRPLRMVGTVQDITAHKEAEEGQRQALARALEATRALEEHQRQLRELNEQLEAKVAARTREIGRRQQVAESLRDILAVLNSNRSLAEILETIVAEARRLLGSGTCAVYHLEVPDGTLRVQTVQGRLAEQASSITFPLNFQLALQKGEPVALCDVGLPAPAPSATDVRRGALPPELADTSPSLLAVPLLLGGVLYGALVLFYAEPREFAAEEVELAAAFGDQAALAIENARLHQQAEEKAVLEERERLARDLHDSVTQSLYSITLLAEGWNRLARSGQLADTDDPLHELGDIAQQALKEMRLMVHELRPPDLEAEGLLGALHQRLGTVEKRAGVEARLVAGDIDSLPAPLEEGLYRIAVEALNNALKHADGRKVSVHIRMDGDHVELDVVDDGCGFDAVATDVRRGMGLDSMRARARQIGGTLTVDSAPGRGTTVRVRVPVPPPP